MASRYVKQQKTQIKQIKQIFTGYGLRVIMAYVLLPPAIKGLCSYVFISLLKVYVLIFLCLNYLQNEIDYD